MTVIEIQGLLDDKCIPRDMRVNETLVNYLARKLAEGERLRTENIQLVEELKRVTDGLEFFSYSTDGGYDQHDSAEKARQAAEEHIDYYRGEACDGWSDETDQVVWGIVVQRACQTDLREVGPEDSVGSHITQVCDYALMPALENSPTKGYVPASEVEHLMAEGKMLKDAHAAILEHIDVTDKGLAGTAAMIANDALNNTDYQAIERGLRKIRKDSIVEAAHHAGEIAQKMTRESSKEVVKAVGRRLLVLAEHVGNGQ
ncbi:hypothetical protein [Morganella psychrotolerans]|uniref:Uncharacterized protein n=1 Tax=Morganella psychrotolerans TaxID=368603 RepID=A0A1B8HMB8_9GAMM|nr:hypothetical protein [Morganella psychrotolerans]OBU10556.1 hypothetical protein AYY17_15550 [Morganella psychrotolerans]